MIKQRIGSLETKMSKKRAELVARVLSVEADLDPWSAKQQGRGDS